MSPNNFNTRDKTKDPGKIIGKLNDSPQYEGSSAGIEILTSESGDKGIVYLSAAEFRNLELGEGIGGSDIYVNGEVHSKKGTILTGTVFLEGFGTKMNLDNSRETSRYIIVDEIGTPVKGDFQLLMRDPYLERTVKWCSNQGRRQILYEI